MIKESDLVRCITILSEVSVKGDDKARLLAVENYLKQLASEIANDSKAPKTNKQDEPGDKGSPPPE